MCRAFVLAVALLSCCAAVAPAQSGQLGQFRREMIKSPDKSDSKDSDDDKSDDDRLSSKNDPTYDGGGQAAAEGLGVACMLLALGPAAMLGDDFSTHAYFTDYPHQDHEAGYMTDVESTGRRWAARLSVEGGSNFDDVERFAGQLWVETSSRWGASARGAYFHEQLPAGLTDDLFLTTLDVNFRIAQHPLMTWYIGCGVNLLTDPHKGGQTHAGINLTYGFDIFPVKPLILSAFMDVGSVGPEGLFHLRGTIGANFDSVEVFAGYDWLHVGGADVHGPLVGVRLWF